MISIFNSRHKETFVAAPVESNSHQSYVSRFEYAVRNFEMLNEEERRERNKAIHRRFSGLLF